MACKIGAITVGQAPRPDVVPEIAPLAGAVEFVQRGALDGLSRAAIAALAPRPGDYILVTRLADGSSVHIAEQRILSRIQTHIDQLTAEGAAGILMLCTGQFPAFRCAKPLLYPQILLQHFVAGVIGDRTLGVLSPDAGQIPQSTRRWRENGVAKLTCAAATPYGDAAAVVRAAAALKEQGADMLVLDCIGYTAAMKEAVRRQTGLPVILPRAVAARAIAELFA